MAETNGDSVIAFNPCSPAFALAPPAVLPVRALCDPGALNAAIRAVGARPRAGPFHPRVALIAATSLPLTVAARPLPPSLLGFVTPADVPRVVAAVAAATAAGGDGALIAAAAAVAEGAPPSLAVPLLARLYAMRRGVLGSPIGHAALMGGALASGAPQTYALALFLPPLHMTAAAPPPPVLAIAHATVVTVRCAHRIDGGVGLLAHLRTLAGPLWSGSASVLTPVAAGADNVAALAFLVATTRATTPPGGGLAFVGTEAAWAAAGGATRALRWLAHARDAHAQRAAWDRATLVAAATEVGHTAVAAWLRVWPPCRGHDGV